MGALDNKPKVTTTQSTTNPYAPSQANLQDILDKAKSIGNDPTMFKPTFSANTQQGLTALGQLGQQPSQTAQAGAPIIAGSQAAYQTGNNQLTKTANGDYIGGNQYMDQVLRDSNQHTADSVNNQFSGAGRFGSGAQTTALAKQIGEQNTAALSGQYNQERTNQLNAAGNLSGQAMQGITAAQGVDAANQNSAGLQVAAGQQQDANDAATRMAPLAQAQAMAGLTNPIASLGKSSSGTEESVQQTNKTGQLIGMGMQGAAMAASMFSDEKLKENITEVGKTHDGQKIYSYNYKGSQTPTLGLLAQEVEKKHPDAVGEASGMKTVNYKKATKDAERGHTTRPTAFGLLAGA